MIYDVIIIWAGASGLFAWIHLPKNLKKLILEKTAKPGMKVLLSWWERANVSNMDIVPERDYFTQNKKFLISIFSRYTNWDIMSFFASNWINIVEEDRWRLVLESWNSRELLDLLLRETKKNWCELKVNQDVKEVIPLFLSQVPPSISPHGREEATGWSTPFSPGGKGWDRGTELLGRIERVIQTEWGQKIYEIKTESSEIYRAKNVIISSGGKSFSHVWTTGEWYNIAKSLWLRIIPPYRTLCGMSTKRDLSEISWVSCELDITLIDINNKKEIYKEFWPMLFTHFGISGPIVFNLSNSIWEYLNNIWIKEIDFEKYILDNLSINLVFDIEKTPKRIVKFFELNQEKQEINLELQNWTSWKEAKATWWWIDLDELDKYMQSKKYPWLFFIWEVVDVTWKTWWFNLQWAWSSAYSCSEKFKRKAMK